MHGHGLRNGGALASFHALAQVALARQRIPVGQGRAGRGGPDWRIVQVQQIGPQGHDVGATGAAAERLERGAADHLLQLAHIARPGVAAQRLLGIGRQAQAAQAQAGAVALQQAPGQQQHVAPALAQRRNGMGYTDRR